MTERRAKDYDEILQDYENDGIIPVAKGYLLDEISLLQHECPWCSRHFIVYGFDSVHCPYCCMEMELDWELL